MPKIRLVLGQRLGLSLSCRSPSPQKGPGAESPPQFGYAALDRRSGPSPGLPYPPSRRRHYATLLTPLPLIT